MATQQEIEEQMLAFWEAKKIYQKSVKKNSKGEKFYFMDGPPYANGYIHLGTALNKTLKDVIMRSRRLMGYSVFDKPGYDTHGVPIENKVEKELGLQSKQDIEKYGVDKFVAKCKDFATKYIGVMNNEFKNLGVWMDWDNPYITCEDKYIEAIWSAFKEADKKGLLYLGKYPVHVCTRCATAVAFNEIEYARQRDNSVYVKFPVKGKNNTFLLIWTTTPWTLPANTGVMINPEVSYDEIETAEGERWILAKERVAAVMGKMERGFTLKKEYKGKELVGWEYSNPLSKNMKISVQNGYRVVPSARYVTVEDGTGLVHCAPGHGKEDYEVGRANKLDVLSPVDMQGNLTAETGKYAGKRARIVDTEIIEDLKEMGVLAHKEQYDHDYPMCWRDKTPLIMISQPQWFLKISSIQEALLKGNEKVKWHPDWVKLRMKAWLEGIGDWPVSRQRYWGSPLPIWYDYKTGEKIVIGSMEELQKLSGVKKIDMHKPGIDKITIKTKKSTLRRVPEVLDVWFDSGVTSWAALNYPADKKKIKELWPADVNLEGKDQIRGWWNSQFILSQILFDKLPTKEIFMHGMILDLGKKKMSKSEGNTVSPEELIKKYGRDYLRYYLAKNAKGEDTAFNEKDFQEVNKVMMILNNLYSFIGQLPKDAKSKKALEDKWILSRYNNLVKEIEEKYTSYDFMGVCEKLEQFTVQDFSRTYIQMIRDRAESARETLVEIYTGLIILFAPIIPLTTENLWQNLREKKIVKEESVHLAEFPKVDKKKIDENLEGQFSNLLRVIEVGLAERDKAKVGLRWPLASVTVESEKAIVKEVQEILMQQLNVKKVISKKGMMKVTYDLIQTKELEAEGYARELARKIQSERKKLGMTKEQKIRISIFSDKNTKEMLMMNKEFLQERVNASNMEITDAVAPEGALDCSVKSNKIHVKFS